MSFVADQVRRVDATLDRLALADLPRSSGSLKAQEEKSTTEVETQADTDKSEAPDTNHDSDALFPHPSPRIIALQTAIRGLSPNPTSTSDSRVLLKPAQIRTLLSVLAKDLPSSLTTGPSSSSSSSSTTKHTESKTVSAEEERYTTELEWLLAAKATTQVYGTVLDALLGSTVRLANELWYWDDVLSSRRATALYSVQTAPGRVWEWGGGVWEDVKARLGTADDGQADAGGAVGMLNTAQRGVKQGWGEFYGLVRKVIRERSVRDLRRRSLFWAPSLLVRNEVRGKQAGLRKVRLRNANALGILLGEGLANESLHGPGITTGTAASAEGEGAVEGKSKWKASAARNVALMEAVLAKVNDLDTEVDNFDAAIAALTDDDPLYGCEVYEAGGEEGAVSVHPQAVAERLSRVLSLALPQYSDSTAALQRQYGRPSRLVRYWLPVTLGVLSSSTILRILVNRKAELIQWVEDFGATIVDFWSNWVVEPMRKVIGTIRHDEGSEVSIMSKRSLEGDRASLERMVVDFAIDNPSDATGSRAALSEPEIADIRSKVREGDLTPVLRAYEKELSSPFMGTVRGNLIRALLIQIQKTKVDVEVAMGGIDALLKSQELVFGFVGLTPGILVTYFVLRSLRNSMSNKRGIRANRARGSALRQLRNIDRLLVDNTPTDFGELPYRDLGLLLCEVHVLRQAAAKTMPTEIFREFGEEVELLCDVRLGVEKQKLVADRIRWAYGRWLA